MHTMRVTCTSLLLAAMPALAFAEPTRELSVSGPKEVNAGDPITTSVDAQGRISMGPTQVDVAKKIGHPIVTMIPGPRGGVYAGTAGGGLLSVDAGGRVTTMFEAKKLSVSAIVQSGGTLYAATIPSGQILQVQGTKKTKPFLTPKAKYVWALLPDGKNLIAATGEPGQVVRIRPGGKVDTIFDPKENHVRALEKHPRRGFVAGGGQKGIVYHVDGKKVHALYDSGYEEVTAFAFDRRNGDLYASFVSESKVGELLPKNWIGPVKGDENDDSSPIKGSEVVRISADGNVEKLWGSKTEGAMDLTFDAKTGRLYFTTATSKKGRSRVYAIDTKDRDRLVLHASLDQSIATSILPAPTGGALLVGTAPEGRVVRLGPGYNTKSEYVTVEQDLYRVSRIGRVWFDADTPKGSSVKVYLRSGNTLRYDDTWTDWVGPIANPKGGQVNVRRGRYVQMKAVLSASGRGAGPLVKSLHASVVRLNVAPNVREVFMLRRGVYMASMPPEGEKEKTMTLSKSAIRDLRKPNVPSSNRLRVRQGEKAGMMTVAWTASDPNRDALLFRVELSRLDPPQIGWQTVADDLTDPYWSFDSRAYPDGRYQFRVTATDRPSNPPDDALTDTFASEPFVVDNGAPRIKKLRATSPSGGKLRIEAVAEDDTTSIGFAEFAVEGGPWLMLPAKDGLIDARSEALEVDVASSDDVGGAKVERGKRTVLVRVEDEAGNESTASTTVDVR